jgi:hypothetical protein
VHETYREEIAATRAQEQWSWEQLPDSLQESNRHHAASIVTRLRALGYEIEAAAPDGAVLVTFTDAEVERMAEMEHGRWNAERLLSGWTWSEKKDVDRKASPYLVPWQELPEEIKEYDRILVRSAPEILAKVGLQIRRRAADE